MSDKSLLPIGAKVRVLGGAVAIAYPHDLRKYDPDGKLLSVEVVVEEIESDFDGEVVAISPDDLRKPEDTLKVRRVGDSKEFLFHLSALGSQIHLSEQGHDAK